MDTAFIVEDDTNSAEALRMMLSLEGFKALAFADYASAYRELLGHKPCLVLADYRVPGAMAVDEFVRLARTYQPSLPVILISGDQTAVKHLRDLGANGFILKPAELDEIESIVKRHCPRHTS